MIFASKALLEAVGNVVGNTDEEWTAKLDAAYQRPPYNIRPELTIKDVREDQTCISFSLRNSTMEVLSFKMEMYPKCCAMMMFHTFSYNERYIKQLDQLKPILDEMFKLFNDWTWFANRRIVTVMVEKFKRDEVSSELMKVHYAQSAGEQAAVEDMTLWNFEPLKRTAVYYPLFWDYWHQCAKVNDRLIYNTNSYSVLHDLEVIIN